MVKATVRAVSAAYTLMPILFAQEPVAILKILAMVIINFIQNIVSTNVSIIVSSKMDS